MKFYNFYSIILFFVLCSFFVSGQEGQVTIDQHPDIKKLLEFKKDIATTKIYKIQVYQSVDPDKAQTAKADFLDIYRDWPVTIEWNTPNYKVWIGNFSTRLEADRALRKIKENYINAIVFQPKLDFKDK